MLLTHALVEKQYKNGFIAAYAVVMRICALLAFPKTFMLVIFITNEAVKVSEGNKTWYRWGIILQLHQLFYSVF